MNQATVVLLLENLIERIERDAVTQKLKLEGVISEKEFDALRDAIEILKHADEPIPPPESSIELAPQNIPTQTIAVSEQLVACCPIELDLAALELAEPENPEVLLCLDFGTAMSKAFATEETDDNLIDLAIGKQAGQTNQIYALYSSVFITNTGRILFGHRAISESIHVDFENARRLDSIKDILCKGVAHDLDTVPLKAGYNPTGTPLSQGDIVTLFLAYFTDMATSALEEKGYSPYVRRHFTLPVLPPERAPWAKKQLGFLLARAQVLADTLHGEWDSGIDVTMAKQILDKTRELKRLPTCLIDQGIVEPVAAIGSRFRNLICERDSRRLLMVIDVGAGTIDYAVFVELRKNGKQLQLYEIPGSRQVLRQAGDAVDKQLRLYILEEAGMKERDHDYPMIDADLSLKIREMKEELFRSEKLKFSLTNDYSGTIILSDFLKYEGIKKLEESIHKKFYECLTGIDSSYIFGCSNILAIVYTGGGARLPIVSSLSKKEVSIHDQRLHTMHSIVIPKWVTDEYPELKEEFPQLAVAIGGASRDLPSLAPETFQEFRGLYVEKWTIQPAHKGI